jgi:trimethylamine--corrinoid protein Co-methyltransferase
MNPRLKFLDEHVVQQIIQEGFALLQNPGVRIHNLDAQKLLADAGAKVDFEKQVAFIPESLVNQALSSCPKEFYLFDLNGERQIHYGGDDVHFDPGSAAINILDANTGEQRQPVTKDFVDFVKLVETLPQLDAQSTAMICADVPEEIGDLYRLYLALNYMRKPIITGAFRKDTWWIMLEMLRVVSGGQETLKQKPIAVFDVCPSPPLLWSDLTCQNLIDCACNFIPSELVSMPLAGATAPVTLAGAVVQHTAECLSGVTICQLAQPGAPMVWGGSPASFDMREGTTPMGAVETWMIDCAYSQIGKSLGLPTHAYLGMSDSKVVDTQCGLESMGGALLAALAGINMVSGAGMLDFESCQSMEKLIIDAEIIGMVKRLMRGVEIREQPIALDLIRQLGHRAEYLSQPHTLQWFKQEQYIPSKIIDRSNYDGWQQKGKLSAFDRAHTQVKKQLEKYQPSPIAREVRSELRNITAKAAERFGMSTLPKLPENPF